MAKEEFSVNELEPKKNNGTILANVPNDKDIEGPTIKEVLINSINPDYQGPTAREIVVNSVKVDKTKKKNYVGLFVLILFLVLIGIVVLFEINDDDGRKEINYLKDMPKWVDNYNKYLKKEYGDLIAYNLVFLDLDFDNEQEAIINYIDDGKTIYEVIDVEDNQVIKVGEISNILMMYSFIDEDVTWFINTSFNENDMNLIDLKKRLSGNTDYEVNLSLDSLSQFKSNHFVLSYDIKYTKISFRTYEKNLAEAVRIYEEEIDNIKTIVNKVVDKYSYGL